MSVCFDCFQLDFFFSAVPCTSITRRQSLSHERRHILDTLFKCFQTLETITIAFCLLKMGLNSSGNVFSSINSRTQLLFACFLFCSVYSWWSKSSARSKKPNTSYLRTDIPSTDLNSIVCIPASPFICPTYRCVCGYSHDRCSLCCLRSHSHSLYSVAVHMWPPCVCRMRVHMCMSSRAWS